MRVPTAGQGRAGQAAQRPADNQTMVSSRVVGVLASVVTVAIWTGFIVIGRASAALTLLPFDLGLIRIAGAALVAVPWALWLTRRQGPAHASRSLAGLSPLPLRQTLITGAVGGLVYAGLCYAGFFFAPAAHASVLLPGSQPLWAALLAIVLLGEALTRQRAMGLALILAGAALVGGTSLLAAFGGGEVWKGDAFFLVAGACWAGYGVLTRRFALDPVHSTIAITVVGLLSYVPLFVALTASGLLSTHLLLAPWTEIALQLFYQGICVVIVAGITFVTMVRAFGPVRAAMITSLVPGLSALGAALLLGEPLGASLLAGLALVTLGILLGVWPLRTQAAGAALGVAPGPAAK